MRKLLLIIIIFSQIHVFSQTFSFDQYHAVIPMFKNCAFDWGDFNNDGFLDLMVVGDNVQNIKKANLYQGFLIALQEHPNTSFEGLRGADVKWGDYNNDGFIDILTSGLNASNGITHIYKNNGDDTFTEQPNMISAGIKNSSVDWGDYDNDGDLDIVLCGYDFPSGFTRIYRNNGDNTFSELTNITLHNVYSGNVEWCDLNNDSYKDILISGHTGTNKLTTIYKNNGDCTFTEQINTGIVDVSLSSSALGDYDNDNDLDILLSGASDSGYVTRVYENLGNFNFNSTNDSLVGVKDGDVCWGDYDNDGDLDILVSGMSSQGRISKVYTLENNLEYNELTGISIAAVDCGDNSWVDYNYDGCLDIVVTGNATTNIRFYENNLTTINSKPAVPIGLSSQMLNDSILLLTWNKSFDNETDQNALTYNIMIGSSLNAIDIKSPHSILNSGSHPGARQLVEIGNLELDTFFLFNTKNILGCSDIYWSVQTIDNGYKASEFAPAQIAHVNSYLFLDNTIICQGDSILWRGNYLSQTGIHLDSLVTVNSCDSIYELNLIVSDNYDFNENYTICENDSLIWHGNIFTNTGIYYDSCNTIYGCDSIYEMSLSINPIPVFDTIIGTDTVDIHQIEQYYITNDTLIYHWDVEGGTIIQQIAGNIVEVQWDSIGVGHIYVVAENQYGCFSDTTILDVIIGTTIVDNLNNEKVVIYPNPTNGKFKIDLDEFDKIEILNTTGQVIIKTEKKEIDLSCQPAGVYYIRILTEKETITSEIIKK